MQLGPHLSSLESDLWLRDVFGRETPRPLIRGGSRWGGGGFKGGIVSGSDDVWA